MELFSLFLYVQKTISMSLFQVAEAFISYEKKLREISDLIQQIRLLVPELPPSLEQVSEGKKYFFGISK